MARFVDRCDEMAALEEEYEREEASFVVLYGRRRVGKSELLKEFVRGKRAVYYLATEESEALNRDAFQRIAAEMLDIPLLAGAPFSRWEDAFSVIAQASVDERIVLVIDEFQYLGRHTAFPSVFQRVWDTILRNHNVMVVLCGSLVSMMVSQTLSYDSPLYGRRTRQMRLQQIPFKYYGDFFADGVDRRVLIELYSVTGGVPKYIEMLDDSADVYGSIERHVLDKSSYLYDEPAFLLRNEVSEVGSYFSVIKTIAAGNQKLGKIASALEVKSTSVTTYLKTLMDLDIVEREVPVTEEHPEKSRRGLYKIKDNYIRFWFQFVYPNKSFIESGHPELAMRKIKANFVDNHVAFVYEDVCAEHMWELNAQGAWPFTFLRVGRWWDNHNNEIDVVALDPDGGNIVLGECKYWKGKVGASVLRGLEKKAELVNWRTGNRKQWYVLFSAGGFTDELVELAKLRDDLMLCE